MIVPSMNFMEIRKEHEKDFPIVMRKAQYVEKEIVKTYKPRNDEAYIQYFDYKSKYQNTWIYRIVASKKTSHYDFMMYYYDRTGIKGIFSLNDDRGYVAYLTNHFFGRYNERLHLNLVYPNDIIRSFIGDNREFRMKFLDVIGIGERAMFCYTGTGVILGTVDHLLGVYCMNTFISNDMLFKDQRKMVEQLKTLYLAEGESNEMMNF